LTNGGVVEPIATTIDPATTGSIVSTDSSSLDSLADLSSTEGVGAIAILPLQSPATSFTGGADFSNSLLATVNTAAIF